VEKIICRLISFFTRLKERRRRRRKKIIKKNRFKYTKQIKRRIRP